MRFHASLSSVVLASFALIACNAQSSSRDVDDSRLRAADQDTANWITYGRTYNEQRFSPLAQIDERTIGKLGLLWSQEIATTRALQATPLVVDGIIYTTGSWSFVYAIDAKTGQLVWTYDPKVPRERARVVCCDVVNRGVAFYRGKVYVGTIDGRLIALDARDGKPAWDIVTIDQSKPYAITGAPRIAKGKVLIGNAGSEFGVRGYISAYDAETGKLVWRTYTVPGDPALGFESKALERAATTWNGQWWVAGGGGSPWDAIVYDPDLGLVYLGTGNGVSWYRDHRSPGGGDNLYLSSILALAVDTGELAWHYQVTPGDNWDYDATQPLMQAELTIAGRPRKVIMQASKNGFFYVLDRQTGEFISATPMVHQTWARDVDPVTGRPHETTTAYGGLNASLVSPDPTGAHNWHPMAFHPGTGLVYLGVRDDTFFVHAPAQSWTSDATVWNTGGDPRYEGPMNAAFMKSPAPKGAILAWNPVDHREVWRVVHPVSESGGVLATGGNLVLQGRGDGMLVAYRATDGKVLWQFNAGTGIVAPPMTYLVNGVQYISVMVGWGGAMGLLNPPGMGPVKPGFGRILTFALGGTATLSVPAFGHTEPPKPAIRVNATPATIREGGFLYATYCVYCHGVNAVAGITPDLRYATKEVHDIFAPIVIGGARQTLGMPSFKDKLTSAQVQAIQAYVLSRAEAANPPATGR